MIKNKLPRIPLRGEIDLTYRCNNRCRHCWISIPEGSTLRKNELPFEKIRKIVDEARALGCRQWAISGGEPLLHPEFEKIFDYITSKSITYSINTNGTLITPEIAEMFKKKGSKMVALYGATEEIHDHITRIKGSYQATMQGFKNLIRVGAGFTVQIVPMRDNFHQYIDMIELAKTLSPHYRIGAAWLFKSASRSESRNNAIEKQRLDPKDVIFLDNPVPTDEAFSSSNRDLLCTNPSDDFLFTGCIEARREFHIDPYGGISFCSFIQDPALRIDLKKTSFQDAWEKIIPSLAVSVRGGEEYRVSCKSCEYREDCRWCPVYAYLEHRRYSAPVDYLCRIARESRHFKEDWKQNHIRLYKIAGITIQVETDLPITDETFHNKFGKFQTEDLGTDRILIRHHFSLPEIDRKNLGNLVYKRPPWAIYHLEKSWIYLGIFPDEDNNSLHRVAVFNENHTRGKLYSPDKDAFQKGNLNSLTMFTSDQILIARILADREACYFHAAGMILYGKGVAFVGHSEAGKSTTVTMLRNEGEILCDDRIIVRRWPDGFRIHGTWCNGDIPDVSNASAPLKAIFFIEKANTNEILLIEDRKEIFKLLPFYVVKPLMTADWWEKTLVLLEKIVREVPVYRLKLDKSGRVKTVLKEFLSREGS